MTSLLNFVEVMEFLPFFLMPIGFLIIFAAVIATVVKRVKAEKRRQEFKEKQARQTDVNGRTAHQRDYINSLRVRQSENKVSSLDASHSHSGKEEHYDPIVGSLGEVNDEGCDDLNGVRLVEHDESYCDDPEHLKEMDYEELQRVIVMGEVINNPRFNNPYVRKK